MWPEWPSFSRSQPYGSGRPARPKSLYCACCPCSIVPFAYWSFESRFSSELPEGGYDERAAFQNAAKMMLSEHPLGVGANNYVVVANVGGYDARAHVADTYGSLSTNVHNAYLLVAAETGYFGLLAFVILLLRPLIVAFRCGWRSRKDPRGDLLLGLGAALLTVYIHCFFEWIFLHSSQCTYLL